MTQKSPEPLFELIEEESRKHYIAAISSATGELLNMLITMGKYQRVLEIGTGMGYSTIWLAKAVSPWNGSVVTIERVAQRAERAAAFFQKSGLNNISLLVGDAKEIVSTLDDKVDFIFLDACIGQYREFFDILFPRLRPCGMFVADNVLIENLITRDRNDIPRRRRTMQYRLRDFLHFIRHHAELTTAVLPIGDGLAVCRRHE